MDSDSMKGKIWLVLVDKLFIGLIMAATFLVYDAQKTTEFQNYNNIIIQQQHEFQRAEFTKELLPVVLDDQQDISVRIAVLGSLVNTGSIDENTAFTIVLSFLDNKLLFRSGHRHAYLIKSLEEALSPIIPTILRQIVYAYPLDELDDSSHYVLIKLFEYAWSHFPDEKLPVLNDRSFVSENLETLMRITPQRHIQYEAWSETSLLALRILHDIELLSQTREEHGLVRQARDRLAKLVRPNEDGVQSMRLSASIFYGLRRSIVTDEVFIEAGVSIMTQRDKVEQTFGDVLPDKHNPYRDQFVAARDYVFSASAYNRRGEELAMPIVRDLLDALRSGPIPRGNYPVERMAVCVLFDSMSAMVSVHESGRSDEADEVLRSLSEISEDRLRSANVKYLIDEWRENSEKPSMEKC